MTYNNNMHKNKNLARLYEILERVSLIGIWICVIWMFIIAINEFFL